MFPLRATGSRQLLPHVNGSPVLRVLWADPTPQRPSVPLAFSVQVAYLSSLVPSCLGARRSLCSRVSPSVPRRPCSLQDEPEIPGVHGASQVLRRSSPCMPCPDDPGRPPESHQNDSFAWASRKRNRLPPASSNPFRGCTRPQEGAVFPTAYMVPCVRFKPFVRFAFRLSSSRPATLGTGGWLDLTRQGLAPCKKRQACLGAHVPGFTGRRRA
jgi:hypothetical protein